MRCRLTEFFFFKCTGDHRALHVRTHSFPTRRSSDLIRPKRSPAFSCWPSRASQRMRRATRPAICTTAISLPLASRSEEHTSELQSLMRNSYAVFSLKKINLKTMQLKRPHLSTDSKLKHREKSVTSAPTMHNA